MQGPGPIPSTLLFFLLPHSPLSRCLSQHTNKRQRDEKDSANPFLLFCHYRTDTLGVKRYDAEHQGELYITLLLFALFHVYFTPSSRHVWLTPLAVITTIIHRTSLWNIAIASGYICLSLGKCVKNQKCSPKYVRCHLIISVMIPPFPFLCSHTLWTSAEGIEIIKNRYSKALTQKDFPQSLPLSGTRWAREDEMSKQRSHRAQVKRSHFNAVKMYCSQFSYHKLLSSKCLFHHLLADLKNVYTRRIWGFRRQ